MRAERLEEVVGETVRALVLAPRRVAAAFKEQRAVWLAEGERERKGLDLQRKSG